MLAAASWDNSRSGSVRSAGCPNLQQGGQKVIYEIFSVFVEQDACCCELGQLALRERAERRLSQPAAGRTKGDLRNILSVRGAGCLLLRVGTTRAPGAGGA